jgi:hypothetical protein
MELLLNLAWMLLVLPAYWLWRRARVRQTQKLGAAQGLVALGCLLVLLFPVISASDDLHAMRAEMEESSISKRAVRATASDKHSSWVNRLQGPPAVAAIAPWLAVPEVRWYRVGLTCAPLLTRPCVVNASRAPPFSLLG